MRIKVGIFFGGPSRERELSFTSGRTVFDNLDRQLFEPVLIFVDSRRNFIELDWKHLYASGIREFFPATSALSGDDSGFSIYQESLSDLSEAEYEQLVAAAGRLILPEELPQLINLAFLALYGEYGEDGQIQQQLTGLRIPFTGNGIEASRLGNDKARQKEALASNGITVPAYLRIEREEWLAGQPGMFFEKAARELGLPLVVRPVDQGSAIGLSIVDEEAELEAFVESVNSAFFREVIPVRSWLETSAYDKADHLRLLTDLRDGLGFPVEVTIGEERATFAHPQDLLVFLNDRSETIDDKRAVFVLESKQGSPAVLLESFVDGREFSCSLLRQDDGRVLALPLTEISRNSNRYESLPKYLPDHRRQITPMALPASQAGSIRQACERLFSSLGLQGFARMDGFLTNKGEIIISDIDTMVSFWPGALIFRQAGAIGLAPTALLTFLIRNALQERIREHPGEATFRTLMQFLDEHIAEQGQNRELPRIAVILGGNKFERNRSVETGRNVCEKLTAAGKYLPVPVFLASYDGRFELYRIPAALLQEGNADSIREAITGLRATVSSDLQSAGAAILQKYGTAEATATPQPTSLQEIGGWARAVFIALHGRPGEDGQLQKALDDLDLPYNGSDAQTSAIAIDKRRTLEILQMNGFSVPRHIYATKADYEEDAEAFFERVEAALPYPLIGKPVDEGGGTGVHLIRTRRELEAYTKLLFRRSGHEALECRYQLRIRPQEPFPRKSEVLFEEQILPAGASRLLEVTLGVLIRPAAGDSASDNYEVLPAVELGAIRQADNTEERRQQAALFADSPSANRAISKQVAAEIERATRVLHLQQYARIDAFVRVFEDNSAETIILEANTLPTLAPAAPLFSSAALAGYTPHELINGIVGSSLEGTATTTEPAPLPVAPAATEAPPPPPELVPVQEPTPLSPQKAPKQRPAVGEWFRKTGRNIWAFLSDSYFLKNFGALLGFLLIMYLLVNFLLRVYTHHGESLQVQNYIGMDLSEAERTAQRRSFKLVIIDSVFLVDREPNRILEQEPQPFSRVKENRSIYVTITSQTPPMVTLPEMTGAYNYDQYSRKLIRLGMKPYIKDRQFNNKLEENTILYFEYDGQRITDKDLNKGIKAPKGSEMAFVVTERLSNYVDVPDLRCKTFEAAAFQLSANNLIVGDIRGNVRNRDEAFVYDQEPAPGGKIRMGEQITVYLTTQRPAGCPEEAVLPDPEELEQDSIF